MGFHFLGRSRCLYWVAKCKCSCYSCYSGTRAGVQLKPRKGKLCSVYKPQTATCHRFIPGHLLKLACGGWGLCCFFVGLFFSSFSLSPLSFFCSLLLFLSFSSFLHSFLLSSFLICFGSVEGDCFEGFVAIHYLRKLSKWMALPTILPAEMALGTVWGNEWHMRRAPAHKILGPLTTVRHLV